MHAKNLAVIAAAAAFFILKGIPCLAKSDAKPSWVDTLPPIVTIEPKQRYHSKIFHATLSANKRATIWVKTVYPGKSLVLQEKMDVYRDPITISEEGKTVVYFFAEDLLGNKSVADSMEYVLDTRPPEISISPAPGRFRSPVTVRFTANEPCRFFLHAASGDTSGKAVAESLTVRDSLAGYITAVDRAGNGAATAPFSYIVDLSTPAVTLSPREGIYKKQQSISFAVSAGAEALYSFDPSAPPQSFARFEKPVALPFGATLVRYYARNGYGSRSEEQQAVYTIDTLPPKIHLTYKPGEAFDTLVCSTKKSAKLWYTLDNSIPTEEGRRYERPIVVAHRGKCVFKAIAKDSAGNVSEVFEWQRRYDVTPPAIAFSRPGGRYTTTLDLQVRADKPASVFYTLDGSEPTGRCALYRDRITLSKEGATTVRAIAIDDEGNSGPELSQEYIIDTKPPEIRVKIDENPKGNVYFVTLIPDEEAAIYYETGDAQPTVSSPVYGGRLRLKGGQVLRYFAVDKSGNRTPVKVMDDLERPLVAAVPPGGMYNKRIKVSFAVNINATIFWRIAPDSVFRPYSDSIAIAKEGAYSLEYYSETAGGLRSPMRRNEYTIDLTPPHVTINVKKGVNDSVTVFFECTKNATIYYTTDGSNPFYSATTRTLGNKFLLSKDRLSLYRRPGSDIKLALYAEDVAGNQSTLTVLDVFKPQAVPTVPAGKDLLYDRIVSVSLNTYDSRSQIYFARHGHAPTLDSAVFTSPITLVQSDTIIAFVVDAAGYRGEPDTFVYRIDLPPSPDFSFSPDSIFAGIPVHFDASGSIDHETPLSKLLFRWDFVGDKRHVTKFTADPRADFSYAANGLFHPALEVKDENGRIAVATKELLVRSLCPQGMVSIALAGGKTYCIDKYEWPDIPGQKPAIGYSWVQAKMSCRDAGKRLCTPEEWRGACRGLKGTVYPYGNVYEKKSCPSQGKALFASGAFPRCTNAFGVYDMAGNVWEWVEGKKGDYPLMFGGSFSYGERADCDLSSQGSIGARSDEVGFRCCK